MSLEPLLCKLQAQLAGPAAGPDKAHLPPLLTLMEWVGQRYGCVVTTEDRPLGTLMFSNCHQQTGYTSALLEAGRLGQIPHVQLLAPLHPTLHTALHHSSRELTKAQGPDKERKRHFISIVTAMH